MRDILQRGFEEWFDFGSDRTVNELEKMIERVNKNDHFEFHRLKYLSEIEIAEHLIGSRFTLEDVEDMRKQYGEFEEKINQIEDDRQYRDQALDWLSEGKDSLYAPDTKSNRIEKLENLHFEVKRIKSGSSKKRKQ